MRLSKPKVPEAVRDNFLEVAATEAELKIAGEREAVVLAVVAKDKALAVIEARKQLEVAAVAGAAAESEARQRVGIDRMVFEASAARAREQVGDLPPFPSLLHPFLAHDICLILYPPPFVSPRRTRGRMRGPRRRRQTHSC